MCALTAAAAVPLIKEYIEGLRRPSGGDLIHKQAAPFTQDVMLLVRRINHSFGLYLIQAIYEPELRLVIKKNGDFEKYVFGHKRTN